MSPDIADPWMPVSCASAREAMEIAAVEPGGLDRLVAARPADPIPDGATAAGGPPSEPMIPGVPDVAIANHVATCADCSAELARLREIAVLLGDAMAPEPPAELRARTLAFVAQAGRDRSGAAAAAVASAAVPAVAGADAPVRPPAAASLVLSSAPIEGSSRSPRALASHRLRARRVAFGVLALAAAFILAIGGTALVVGSIARSDVAAERSRNAALAATAESALRLMADPAAIHIPMRDGAGSAVGMAVVAPATYDATVVAVGLPEPPAGHEYACYIVIDGQRVLVGRMADGGATYAWAGTIAALAGVAPGSVGGYGVLLVPAGSTSTDGTPVLSGSL